MSAERDRLVRAIQRGGSVRHKGVQITSLKDLPTEEDLASDAGRAALKARTGVKAVTDRNVGTVAPAAAVTSKKKKAEASSVVIEEDEEEDED